jgi:hypothetical protein
MKKQITKKRIFEVMSRLDKTFKPKLNEGVESNEYLPITTPLSSADDKLFTGIVNQGIDSHLEGFTQSKFDVRGNRRIFNFHKSELPILLRRLEELGTEEALKWKDDIENYKEEPLDETVGLNEGSGLGTPINKWVYFSFNYPHDFIGKIWADEPVLVNHLNEKFISYYDKYGPTGVMNKFYVELDSGNQKKLEDWILANYMR